MPRQTKRTAVTPTEPNVTTTVESVKEEVASTPVVQAKPKMKEAPELSLTDYVTVRNGFNGRLVYKSKKTGEKFVWDGFGAEQDMELAELKNAKNSSKAFFESNWFMFDDPAVITFLGVERFYKDALRFDNFDQLFEMKPEDVGERISKLSEGQKLSVRYRARQLIADGMIDSIKMIGELEKALNTELIER